jgi:hypothetical protein
VQPVVKDTGSLTQPIVIDQQWIYSGERIAYASVAFGCLMNGSRSEQESPRSPMPFNNHLTRPPYVASPGPLATAFLGFLFASCLTEKLKEGRNSLPLGNLSQPPNPRPTRPLSSYSSPFATGLTAKME